MRTQSNTPIVEIQRWKEGEWSIAINHKDNGVQPEGEEGKRYEADFTIFTALTADEAIYAFTRMTADPLFDQKVIDNIEVAGKPAIETKPTYATKVEPTIFKALPTSGALKRGQIYSYANGAVMVVQDHDRTIYAPELTPALFSFYRPNPEGTEWIAGEQVALNSTRTYGGKTYKCIQAHQTQDGWKPDVTPALWQEVVVVPPDVKPPQWNTGDWEKYTPIGFEVFDSGKVWKVKTLSHTWIQPALTGTGAISWEYVKDWIE